MKIFLKIALQSAVHFAKVFGQSQKTIAEPENSNNLLMANSSTPLNRAFFVCSTRTPKERLNMACSPMVACSGKGFALCCVPLVAVSQPVTRYRPKPENFRAVTSSSLLMELSAMIYKFLLLGTRLKISTYAQNEAQARQFLNLTCPKKAICFARVKGASHA